MSRYGIHSGRMVTWRSWGVETPGIACCSEGNKNLDPVRHVVVRARYLALPVEVCEKTK